MKGNAKVIDALNSVLTRELTAINQYFIHARMLQDWGMDKLGALEYKASIDEMKHADEIIKRILFLEGLPNVQKLDAVRIGQTVEEIISNDLTVEMEAVKALKGFIKLAEDEQDYVSRELLVDILSSEEEHIDWLETQKSRIEKAGLQNYHQTQIEMDD